MDNSDNPLIGCIIFLILLLLNSIFYGFDTALNHINETKIEKKAEQGDSKSKIILKMLASPWDFMNTIQLIITFFCMTAGSFSIKNLLEYIFSFFQLSIYDSAVTQIFVMVLTIILCLTFVLSIGILVPRKIFAHHAERMTYRLVSFVHIFIIILLPVNKLIQGMSNLIVRIFGIDPHHMEDDVTEDEIIDLVDEAHEQGVIQESEAEMIQNIMEFSDKDAKDIMTHRKNIYALEDHMTLEEAICYMTQKNNSRYPVYHENIDNIIGFIHMKDAIIHMMKKKQEDRPLVQIPELIRTVAFIPETRGIDSIFKAMKLKKVHMAIVVDEYGQTAGLLTMEDIIEEIVGNILDEYDESEDFIQPQFDESILMDGLTPLDDVEKVLGIQLDECSFETLNGYLTSLLEHIPTEEDREIKANGYCFQILSVENNIIQKLRVEKIQ